MKPLKLTPAFKDYIWGGNRLKTEYKMESELSRLAEAWVFSCHKDGQSVVSEGELAGLTLSEAIEELGDDVLGLSAKDFPFFPILIKLIDAKQPLSVQVHPSDDYALSHENQFGKTEMWYIVDCDEGASLYYGFKKEISREEFAKRIEENTLTDVLNKVPVHKGDVFFIEAGTLHAIGKGILIAEIQQNSNTTYRIYDYGRVGADGKPRELHVEKACQVTDLVPPTRPTKPMGERIDKGGYNETLLATCEYFNVNKLVIDTEAKLTAGEKSFNSLLVLEGSLEVDGVSLVKGESCFIPSGYGEYSIKGKGEVIVTDIV